MKGQKYTFDIRPQSLTSPSAVVHLEYDPETLSPPPSDDWTRFVCISDTHTKNFPVPDGDVLLHGGDLTNEGTLEEFEKTMEWLYSLPHKIKIVIAGNHDLTLDREWYAENWEGWHDFEQPYDKIIDLMTGERAKQAGIMYLEDTQHTFQTKPGGRSWTVHGSPWSPFFCDWAFNYREPEAEEIISKIPDVDILITHGPAHEIFDRTNQGILTGCRPLRRRLAEMRPRLHLAGHIHEAHGGHIHRWIHDDKGQYHPPTVQNDNDDDSDESEGEAEAARKGIGAPSASQDDSASSAMDTSWSEIAESTVFVNAANSPLGRHSWRIISGAIDPDDKRRVPCGGPGFQAVIVDLKD